MTTLTSPDRRFKPSRFWLLIPFLVLLLVWKTMLWLSLPLPTTDGVQSLSHTYSILRGEFFHSMFWHNWMEIYQLPYGFGMITAVITTLLPFGALHNFFATALLLALATAAVTYGFLVTAFGSKKVAGITALMVLLEPHLWMMRPEAVAVPLLLVALWLLRGSVQHPRLIWLAASAFCIAFAGIAHPMGGLIGVLLISLLTLEDRASWRTLFNLYALIGVWLVLLYFPVIIMNVGLWQENFLGFFTSEEPRGFSTLRGAISRDLPRFIGWSMPLIGVYVLGILRSWGTLGFSVVREIGTLVVLLIPILAGGGGSYFAYLIVWLVWRISRLPFGGSVSLPFAVALLLIAPLWTHYFPTFQLMENPRYGETVRAIMTEVEHVRDSTPVGKVWVSNRAALPIIDQPYARALANYYALGRAPQLIPLESGDMILYLYADEAAIIDGNYAIPARAVVENVIPPVPGPLTFESLLRERLPDIGYWRITVP